MEFSGQQLTALEKVESWIKSNKPSFLLFGYAGTGKTTLARHLMTLTKNVIFAAPTNKAARVLARKTGVKTYTLHQICYMACTAKRDALHKAIVFKKCQLDTSHGFERKALFDIFRKQGVKGKSAKLFAEFNAFEDSRSIPELQKELKNTPVEFLCRPVTHWDYDVGPHDIFGDGPGVLVIDECSMVCQKDGEQLSRVAAAFGYQILALGDPGQLEPVAGRPFFPAGGADVTLTEIHRQAEGNPVLALSGLARRGKPLPPGAHGKSLVLPGNDFTPARAGTAVMWADKIITGRNQSVSDYNKVKRRLLGRPPELVVGDVIMAYTNVRREKQLIVANGDEFEVLACHINDGIYTATIEVDGVEIEVRFPGQFLDSGETPADYESKNPRRGYDGLFRYAYAITGHKSQGSEWPKVLIVDGMKNPTWLYTAITRASEAVGVVL